MSDRYDRDKQAAVDALAKIDPRQPYGTELFNAIARISVSVCIEGVCLRKNPLTKAIEVLLIQRAENDTAYPGQMHCPGTIMRPGESMADMFCRLTDTELDGMAPNWFFAGFDNNPAEARGHFFHLIFLARVDSQEKGNWYPVESLPPNTIEHHRITVIPTAVKAFIE
jgi:ADP-ribose pyrophosphatase YjhB (NUDIX family)